jgi:DNA-binding MurR/RpiR family transcriptional regulator
MSERAGRAAAKASEAITKASVHARIRSHYEALSPAEKRLADVILNFPGDLAGYSATELAEISEVSNTAVSRFVRRLGFTNYDEMRRLARKEQEEGAPLYLLERNSAGPTDLLSERHVETVIANLRRTFSDGAGEVAAALSAAIATAPQVWICGFRHGRFLADYLRWSLAHARPGVRALPGHGETLGESMIDIGPKDVVVIFAMRRRVPIIPAILQASVQVGAEVGIITDPGMVSTAGAKWVIRCQTKTRGPIDDHASALAVAHLLTEQVLVQLQKGAKKRLGEIDDLHDRLDELE